MWGTIYIAQYRLHNPRGAGKKGVKNSIEQCTFPEYINGYLVKVNPNVDGLTCISFLRVIVL